MTSPSLTRGAVIYARVSTNEQAAHGTSMDSQTAACRAKALALNLPIVAICEDPGVSGSDYHTRPGIMEALRLVESGAASVLLATKIDRIGRSARVVLDIADRVEKAGGELITDDVKFDNTPGGRFLRTIYAGMAEMEREAIRERTMSGNRASAQKGRQPARQSSPYGYKVPTKTDVFSGAFTHDQIGQYLVIEEEAAVVRQMFQKYASGGYSLHSICKWLNGSALPRPHRGGKWHASSVRYILKNPAYKGEALFGRWEHRTDERLLDKPHPYRERLRVNASVRRAAPPEQQTVIACPALVTSALWEQAAVRLAENKAGKSGNPERVFMLSGRAVCAECGEHMIIISQRAQHGPGYQRRYQCGARRRVSERACCSQSFSVEDTERALLGALLDACQRPEVVREALKAYRAEERGADKADPRKELAALGKALDAIKGQEAAAVQAQIAGIMAGASPDAYAETFASLAARRKDLEDRRGQLRQAGKTANAPAQEADMTQARMTQVLAGVRRTLTSPDLTGAQKRDLLGNVVQNVACLPGGAKVRFAPGALAWEERETEHTVKTQFRKAGRDAVLSDFPVGASVAAETRGGSNGLPLALVLSDTSADASAQKALLKIKILSGVAHDVNADKGLLTIVPKAKPKETIAVAPSTKIKVRKIEGTLKDITDGMHVTARLTRDKDAAGHFIASSLSASEPARKKTPATKKTAAAVPAAKP